MATVAGDFPQRFGQLRVKRRRLRRKETFERDVCGLDCRGVRTRAARGLFRDEAGRILANYAVHGVVDRHVDGGGETGLDSGAHSGRLDGLFEMFVPVGDFIGGRRVRRPVEIIFRGVRHARFLADVCRVSTGRGRRTACGVHALDVGHPAEFAAALVRHRLEQKPWDRTGVGRGAALQHRADHFAAVFVFPSGPGVV